MLSFLPECQGRQGFWGAFLPVNAPSHLPIFPKKKYQKSILSKFPFAGFCMPYSIFANWYLVFCNVLIKLRVKSLKIDFLRLDYIVVPQKVAFHKLSSQ
jgi:hypothetical protein